VKSDDEYRIRTASEELEVQMRAAGTYVDTDEGKNEDGSFEV